MGRCGAVGSQVTCSKPCRRFSAVDEQITGRHGRFRQGLKVELGVKVGAVTPAATASR
jgi:hypothetical protein